LGALPGKTPGSYLIEERAMAVVPSPQMIPALVNEPGQEKLKKRLLLLGDVDYDADPGVQRREPASAAVAPFLAASRGVGADLFQALPGTRDEIDAIERICRHDFPADDDVTKLVRAAATKRAFWEAASQHASIHVATHGFFAPPEVQSALATPTGLQNSLRKLGETAELQGYSPGLLSGLVLTGANRAVRQDERGSPAAEAADNGILTAEEINSMNLEGVTLVTLSACETGLGKVAGGEGLLGLQRGFQVAGARAVVASLWKVDDQGTQTLMVEFYKNLWEKKLPKLEALREAQLTMLRGYDPKAGKLRGSGAVRPVDPKKLAAAKDAGSLAREGLSPFYWAAFVLSGDWR
jgi:CHAT domain-containing protein